MGRLPKRRFLSLLVLGASVQVVAQSGPYPHNAVDCERCHNVPSKFGGSLMTVQRLGSLSNGKFVPASEGGIHHRQGESAQNLASKTQITGERISISLLGDGYIEAIDPRDIERNARRQRGSDLGIAGMVATAPILEARGVAATGRFGWKSQHASLLSSCADSLRNELGIRNRLYPDEYPTRGAGEPPTPFDTPDPKTGKTELDRLADEVRHTEAPSNDSTLAATPEAQAGQRLFVQVGCALCHVPTYKTLPLGTRINGGTYKIPNFIANTVVHPYSDFLLHDLGTGDSIPQAATPEYLDRSSADKFRTPPLWGLRFRNGLMHDGNAPGIEAAIVRHAGEAAKVRNRYDRLSPEEKKQVEAFLNSL